MKKTLLSLLLLTCAFFAKSQITIINESFNAGVLPPDWVFSGGTSAVIYNNPSLNCTSDKGIVTTGIGGGTPSTFETPAINYNPGSNNITLSFDFFLLDANGTCVGASTIPPCPVTMNIWVVPSTYTTITKDGPPTGSYAKYIGYKVVNVLGNNTVTFDASTFAIPSSYRIYVNFSAPCVIGGKKIWFDNFVVTSSICNTCPPTANNDLFALGTGGWASGNLLGNVYGGYALWASDAQAISYPNKSLSFSPAVNNGTDGDLNGTALQSASVPSGITFELVTPLTVLKNGCSGTPNIGTLTFNSTGTFTYVQGAACVNSVYFSYRIKNNVTGLFSNTATVTINISDPISLPVSFKSFSATRNNQNVSLKWETASEQNNKGFYVQRSLGNGEWKDVAFVFSSAEHGNSSAALSYSLNDLNINKGISQYRLLQVDMDGHGKYSEVRSVRGEEMAARLMVYPNPSNTGTINILFEDATAAKDVMVSDLAGRLVKQYSNVSGSLEVKKLKSGFYTIRVLNRSTGAASVEKVIVNER